MTMATTGKPLAAGQEVASCQIVRLLGRGGMGEVYLAEDRALQRPVALKVIRPDRCDPGHVQRFLREAQTCSRIHHPNVVAIHAAGQHGSVHYILMQYIEGRTLADLVQERDAPLPWRAALKLLGAAARGTAAVHRLGVIHRDIKPSNIMLSTERQVYLMDFGLARELSRSDLTMTGEMIGTPAFMSPEQCNGNEVSPRSDVFSLGGTLYYLLTARLPFDGPPIQVVAQITLGKAPPPVCEVNPYVPRPVSELVAKAMAFDPAVRFADAQEFAAALAEAGRSESTQIRGPGETEKVAAAKVDTKRLPALPVVELIPEPAGLFRRRIIVSMLAGGTLLVLGMLSMVLNLPRSRTPQIEPSTPRFVADPPSSEPPTPSGSFAPYRGPPPQATVTLPKTEPNSAPPLQPPASPIKEQDRMVWIPPGLVRVGNRQDTLRKYFLAEAGLVDDATITQYMATLEIEDRQQQFVPGFWIDRYEVTNEAYAHFVRATRRPSPLNWDDGTPPAGCENHPVVGISHADANAFASWVGKRLCTDLQWLRAFRGDTDRLLPWGNSWEPGRANVEENPAFQSTSPVTATPHDVSMFDVCNLVGNADEMMRDLVAREGQRVVVVRGAHWNCDGFYYGLASKPTFARQRDIKANTGFRCVKEAP